MHACFLQKKANKRTTQPKRLEGGHLMSALLFYQRPIPLNRKTHKDLRLKANGADFSFAAKTNSVPLAASEFYDAQRDYPIVFANTGEGVPVPLALLGLRQGENLFVAEDKRWEADYIPAFARSYPFVLARNEGADDFLVCVDETAPFLDKDEGEPLFTEDGQESEALRSRVDLLSEFQGHMQRTREFCERLAELGLFKEVTLQVVPEGGEPLSLQGVQVVDEPKLVALADDQVLPLFRSGELGWIYAHLASLRNVQRLTRRLARRLHKAA